MKKINCKICFVTLTLVFFSNPLLAIEFDEQIEWMLNDVIKGLHQRAMSSGDRSTATYLNKNTISIDWDAKVPGASATHGIGSPSVRVSPEMLKLIHFFADLEMLPIIKQNYNSNSHHQCMQEYSQHIKGQIIRVYEGDEFSSNFSTYDAPEEFARNSRYCKDILRYLPLDRSSRVQRDAHVSNAIAFILLHELGHVVLKHRLTVRPNEISQSVLCVSRKNEKEADGYSVRRLVQYGLFASVISNPYWSFSMTVSSIFPDFERASTHPSPSRRWSESFNLAISEMSRLGLTVDSRLIPIGKQMLELQKRIERQLSDSLHIVDDVKC